MNPLNLFYTVRAYVDSYAGFIGRRFLSVIWLVALSVVIWFYGYLLAFGTFKPLEPVNNRLIAIGVLVVAWIIYMVVSTIRGRRADAKMIDDIAGDGKARADAEARAEVDVLRTRLKEAMALLRKTVGKRLGYVYDLPWYLIIGAPGSGKTTSLTQSGLKFPLGEAVGGEPVGGVGGTRNCNWWFSEEAIIIDTAGRYTTQGDFSGVDKAGWNGFLALLRRHRPSQPINGALVTLSVPDLLDRDPAERLEEIRSIRQRLSEMDEILKARIPIYVVLTKADLLDGFVSFFDGLPRSERDQVWGMTFDLDLSHDPKTLPDQFLDEFDLLRERIAAHLLERMQQEPDIEARGRVFQLPARLSLLREPVHEILTELCAHSRFVAAPMVRGVYIASGTQDGVGAPATARSGRSLRRSYFLSRLFKEVIFEEAALVARDKRLSGRSLLIRRAAFGLAAGLVAVVLAGWISAFFHNRGAIAHAEEQTALFTELSRGIPSRDVADEDFVRLIPALDAMATATSQFDEPPPLGFDFGLDQGAKVEGSHRLAYGRALNALLLPRLMVHLQNRLQDGDAGVRETFDALKLYGMFGGLGPLDPAYAVQSSRRIFDEVYAGEGREATRASLLRHVEALVERPIATIGLDERLVASARATIASQSLAARAYDILRDTPEAGSLTAWTPAGAIGSSGEPAFERRSGETLREGIPGLFTREGFRGVVLPQLATAAQTAVSEDWVRGRAADASLGPSDIARDTLSLYLAEFDERWRSYLGDLGIKQASDLGAMTEVARILSTAPYPLTELSRSVADATNLVSPPPQVAADGQDAVAAAGGAAADAVIVAALPVDPASLPDPYRGLREALAVPATATGEGAEEPVSAIASLQPLIEALYAQLSRASSSSAEVAAIFDVDGQLNAANQALVSEARRMPPPVDGWVGGLSAGVESLAVNTARASLDAEWRAGGARVCTDAIAGRYPFDRAAEREVAIDDFVRVFGPEGVFESFYKERLEPFVDTSVNPWRWRGTFGAQGAESDALQQFARARQITQAFFTEGERPSVSLNITPVSLSDAASAVILEVEGERVVYFHGPILSKTLVWPSREGTSLSRVIVQPVGWDGALSRSGPWSPMRLFDLADKTTVSDDRFRARFDIGGYDATFEVQVGSILNPFATDALSAFRCPAAL